MLNTFIAGYLQDYFDEVFSNFDPDQLAMNLFSGNITLRNLELRPEAAQYCLSRLHKPLSSLEVIKGTVSEVQVNVSANLSHPAQFSVLSFASHPVEVKVSDLNLLAQFRRPTKDFDPAASHSSYDSTHCFDPFGHTLNVKKVDNKSTEDSDPSQEQLLDQLVLSFERIHIRVEDDYYCQPFMQGYAVGLQIERLEVLRTDDTEWSFEGS